MYKIIMFLFILPGISFAQSNEMLEITYEARVVYDINKKNFRKIDYDVYIDFEEEKNFEKSLTTSFSLILNETESNYLYNEKIINEQGLESFGYISETGILYKSLIDSSFVQDKQIGNKKFLIQDKLPEIKWSILSEKSEKILGYTTKKAISNLNENYIEAWYSDDIPVSNGPDLYWGLPGLILKVQTTYIHSENSKEKTTYLAKSVTELDKYNIEIPSKGEKVTKKQFEEIQRDRFKKQMEMFRSDAVDKD